MSKSLLIVGCGELGNRLGILMNDLGWNVYGIRRDADRITPSIHAISADLYKEECPTSWPSIQLEYVVFCVAPKLDERAQYNELYYQGLKNVLHWLEVNKQQPKKLLIISSTAVYAQHDGEWVNEESSTQPQSIQGKTMLAMEQLAKQSSIDTSIIRLSGIYGPNRYYLIKQAIQGTNYPASPQLYANRIHIDDAASLVQSILIFHQQGHTLSPYYIGVDDTPAPIQETLAWLRSALGIETLNSQYSERNTGSKRLSNKLAKTTGWLPKYKSYREGYKEILIEYKKG